MRNIFNKYIIMYSTFIFYNSNFIYKLISVLYTCPLTSIIVNFVSFDKSASELHFVNSNLDYFYFISAPSSTPLGVQVQQTENPGELLVSWLPPPRESQHGALQGYHVKAVPRVNQDSGNRYCND